MSRRKESTLKDLYDIFVLTPWWVPLVVAAFIYLVLALVIPAFNGNSPWNILLKMAGDYLSIIVLIIGVASWIGKWWRNKHQLNYHVSEPIRRKTNENYVASGLLTLPWWSFFIIGIALSLILFLVLPHFSIDIGGGLLLNLSMANAVLIPIILLGFSIMSFQIYSAKENRRKILEKQRGIDTIRQLSWRQFEVLLGEYYRRQGYQVIENVNGGADGGVDITLQKNGAKTIVQCKHWKTMKVGVTAIRELYAVLMHQHATQAIFITSGSYTEEALIFAKGKPMSLVDGKQLEIMVPQGIKNAAKISPAPKVIPPAIPSVATPACPQCGSQMILRRARKGTTAGSEFWGCTDYPRCRGTRNVDAATEANY